MRKQIAVFLLLAAVALPSFASVIVGAPTTPRVAADVQIEHRVMIAVREKFGDVAAAHMWVEAHHGNVVLHGYFAEMMSFQIASRVRRVDGVKSARWSLF
jgi:hypothetical protein